MTGVNRLPQPGSELEDAQGQARPALRLVRPVAVNDGGDAVAPVRFYRAADVARRLHCSAWWVKEQARRRRIPYCWIGGSYRFTEEHISQIARLFEVEPIDPPAAARRRAATANTPDGAEGDAVTRLSARVPRRARTQKPSAAA
jgi:hypothetical protein